MNAKEPKKLKPFFDAVKDTVDARAEAQRKRDAEARSLKRLQDQQERDRIARDRQRDRDLRREQKKTLETLFASGLDVLSRMSTGGEKVFDVSVNKDAKWYSSNWYRNVPATKISVTYLPTHANMTVILIDEDRAEVRNQNIATQRTPQTAQQAFVEWALDKEPQKIAAAARRNAPKALKR